MQWKAMQISYDTARFAFCLGFSDDMHSMTLAGLPLGDDACTGGVTL